MMIDITCKNTNETRSFPTGITLTELIKEFDIQIDKPIVAALVNNKLRELNFQVFKPKIIEFITLAHPLAHRMYKRSAIFVLYKAVKDLFPDSVLRVEHSLPGGLYCEIDDAPFEIIVDIAKAIEDRVAEIIKSDMPFCRRQIRTEEAIELFKKHKLYDKISTLETRKEFYTSVYSLGDDVNYFNGYLLPSTGYLPKVEFEFFGKGFLMKTTGLSRFTSNTHMDENSKLYKIFRQYRQWLGILGLKYVGDLNELTENEKGGNIIKISEALQEKHISKIADNIFQRKDIKIVLVSGPSSSGKTTFSKRLSIQLQVLGYDPIVMELDNYFVDREYTPRNENGDYNFETIEAIDTDFFNQQLQDLINGKEIEMPTFNFYTGQREFRGQKLSLNPRSILIIEGIHGLNPDLTKSISDNIEYKIYVSALTPISIDALNPILTTDNRFIRRIVRDYRTRGYSATETINRWNSVKEGEEQNIFPYQENADIIFNSALIYELAVLKTYAEPLLRNVPEISDAYNDAQVLLKFFTYFEPISEREIPPTSILREFLGGSSFVY